MAKSFKKADVDDEEDIDFDELEELSVINPEIKSIVKDSAKGWLKQVGLGQAAIVNVVNDRAVRYTRERSAELVSGVTEATKEEIRRILSTGLAENVGYDAIVNTIKESYAFSEKRAKLIAKNEIAIANQRGSLEAMFEAEDRGLVVKKFWIPDDEACPICVGNADDGNINLDEAFSSGDMSPTAHPNCECSLGSEVDFND